MIENFCNQPENGIQKLVSKCISVLLNSFDLARAVVIDLDRSGQISKPKNCINSTL